MLRRFRPGRNDAARPTECETRFTRHCGTRWRAMKRWVGNPHDDCRNPKGCRCIRHQHPAPPSISAPELAVPVSGRGSRNLAMHLGTHHRPKMRKPARRSARWRRRPGTADLQVGTAARKRSETDPPPPGWCGDPVRRTDWASPSFPIRNYCAEETAPPNTLSHVDGDVPHPPSRMRPVPPENHHPHPPATATILPGRRGVAQSGRAPGSGSGGRRFKSCRPDAARPPPDGLTGSGPEAAPASGCFGRIFPRPFPPRNRAVISALTHGSKRVYSGALAEGVCPGECPFSCSCFLTSPNRV